jgi:hypothetical protein
MAVEPLDQSRKESPTSGFFALDWFWNNMTFVPTPIILGTPLP